MNDLQKAVELAVTRIVDSYYKQVENMTHDVLIREALTDLIRTLSGVGWVAVGDRELLNYVNSVEDIYAKQLEQVNARIFEESIKDF